MNKYYICSLVATLLTLGACSYDDPFATNRNPGDESLQIKLQGQIEQLNLSRANDMGFAGGDKIGVYVVDFNDDGTPGKLSSDSGNALNVGFTFNEDYNDWSGDSQLYFKDDKTSADFYAYYPYIENPGNVEKLPFSVAANQNSEADSRELSGYEASDFLWANTSGVTPKTPIVNLNFTHRMAGIDVRLVEGSGFEGSEWNNLDKSVIVTNTIPDSEIDLSSGIVSIAGSEKKPITAAQHGDQFRAVVVPQNMEPDTRLLSITVDGQSYHFSRPEKREYQSGKLHRFTIQVNKRSAGGDYFLKLIDESVTDWESDLESHNGKAKEYIVIEIPAGSSFELAVKQAGMNPEKVTSLKIVGEMNGNDVYYLRNNFKNIEAINMKEVILRDARADSESYALDYVIPEDAFNGLLRLTTFVFPDKLKIIGKTAFRNTNLSGSLILPEGLEKIMPEAFNNWQGYTTSTTNLSGALDLPSTIKYIGRSAFQNCDFSGDLVLPEGLEFIGDEAFRDCSNLTGELHFPSSLKNLGTYSFMGCRYLTGTLELPRGITKIPSVAGYDAGPKLKAIRFPDSPVEIDEFAFYNLPIQGGLVLPATVEKINNSAFARTQITSIRLPENLESMGTEVFMNCTSLVDTVVIPSKIEVIPEGTFSGCQQLQAVVLPKKLLKIKAHAFSGCHALTYLRCLATTPPEIDEVSFNGVEKDNFVIEVPEESVELYRNAPGWREFKRISSYRNFVARPTKYNVLNIGGEKEIILNADGKWKMTSCPEWCKVTPTSGNMKTTLKLTVNPLSHGAAPRKGDIVFELEDAAKHTTTVNVGQYDYQYDENQCIQLQKATTGSGIDIFLCGDGYDALDISSGIYLEDMTQEMNYIFTVEPYTTYRSYFNVYTAFALSEDSGIEDVNHWRNTKFHTQLKYGTDRAETMWEMVFDYCAATCPQITNRPDPKVGAILVSNTESYEGKTYVAGENFVSLVTKSSEPYPNDARGIIHHEVCGHGLARLADEYVYHKAFINKCPCTCCGHVNELQNLHASGFGLNVSLESGYKKVPWSHLIFDSRYGDVVDIYEGAYFHSRGVFRSEYNSCMNNNIPYFSAWQRELAVKRIKSLAGEPFNFEEFVRLDSREFGASAANTRAPAAIGNPGHHCSGPKIIKNYKFGKSRKNISKKNSSATSSTNRSKK